MSYNNVLVTGGAGFVGSNLAIMLKQDSPDTNVIVLDNDRNKIKLAKMLGVKYFYSSLNYLQLL